MINTIIIDCCAANVIKLYNLCSSHKDFSVSAFMVPSDIETFSRTVFADLAIVNISSIDESGYKIGSYLREINPDIFLIFITDANLLNEELCRSRADGILINPYTPEELSHYMERAKRVCEHRVQSLYIQTFNSFDVFYNMKNIYFSNAKSKELLALCVDRQGNRVTEEEAITILWPDRTVCDQTKRLYRKAVSSLHAIFTSITDREIYIHKRGYCYIVPLNIRCDYYMFLEDTSTYNSNIAKMYMREYEWAQKRRNMLLQLC